MKYLIVSMLIVLAMAFSFAKKPTHNLAIYFMKEFNNDSVQLTTSSTQQNLRATGITSLEDTLPQTVLPMTSQDSYITVKDVVNDKSKTVQYNRVYKYLFIYYSRGKFVFRFSNKLLYVE